jgi:hypothetical protein
MTLREEFQNEMQSKYQGVELLFETHSNKYIEWLEAKIDQPNPKPTYKVGDKVEIVDKTNGHQFEIGERVRLDFYHPNSDEWLAKGVYDWWYLKESEFKPVN